MNARVNAVRLGPRSTVMIVIAGVLGLISFFWPFLLDPTHFGLADTAPLMFGVLLVLVLAVLMAQISEGGIDSKALALLGVLSAFNAALRPLGAGTAGIETVFFLLVLAGRVLGPGFGFTLGCTSLFASALITGGVGPWMPYQMFGCAFVGLGAGLLPAVRGKLELAMLALYGMLSAFMFGFLLNLSFWPFVSGTETSISFVPGAPAVENWHRYLIFDLTTSLGWDTGRAVTNLVTVLVVGPAVLAALRRASRRAAFHTVGRFEPAPSAPPVTVPVPASPTTRPSSLSASKGHIS